MEEDENKCIIEISKDGKITFIGGMCKAGEFKKNIEKIKKILSGEDESTGE